VTVANDTSTAQKAIQGFVQAFNDLQSSITLQTSFDAQTGAAGPLLGNGDILQIQSQLNNVLGSLVGGVNPRLNNLSALGITFNDQGQLSLDQTKLSAALSGQVSGVSLNDIRNLFALTGSSSNPAVQFITGGNKTKGSATPYQVQLTQAATQGSVTAGAGLAASTNITTGNNNFTLKLDGAKSNTITLAPGTYTPQALAQEVQAEINADTNLAGRQVTASLNGNNLVLTSNSFGSSSQVVIETGLVLGQLGFSGGEKGQGQDVVGSYLVNGVAELAHGSGQFLQGLPANANTSGLLVRVTLGATQIPNGPAANLTVTRGIASSLGLALQNDLDPVSGRLKSIVDSLDAQSKDFQTQIDQQNGYISTKHDQLINQFAAMESTISQLQTAGNFLTQQTAASLNQPKV
jgi:flagellar hook-associated protein 2